MKYYKIYFLVVGFIFFTDNLYAKDYEYNGRCSANMTFFESCLDKEFNMYDKELNRIYKYFIKASPHENLKKAEALWVRFKEADCNYVAGEVNGGLEYQFEKVVFLFRMV